MKESEHTPGPWHRTNRMTEIESASGIIADVTKSPVFGVGDEDQIQANARLIAAAPELLESLQRLLLVVEDLMPGIGAIACKNYREINEAPIDARKAIAKATGAES